jgi:hypothetical protein
VQLRLVPVTIILADFYYKILIEWSSFKVVAELEYVRQGIKFQTFVTA